MSRAWKLLTRNVVERQEVVSFGVVWKRGRWAANSCDTGLMLQWASDFFFFVVVFWGRVAVGKVGRMERRAVSR